MSNQSLNFTNKGIKPFTKLVLLCACSLILLFTDKRFTLVQQFKATVMTVIYPIQWVAEKPVSWFHLAQIYVDNQQHLVSENQALYKQNTELSARLNQMQQLNQELNSLRRLNALKQSDIHFITMARLISDGKDPFSDHLIIDKGSSNGVKDGQAVVDAYGLVGEVTSTEPYSAEVTLLTAKDSVIPVMVARTGFRTLIYGESHQLNLRYFPVDADLKVNDILVTSGIDDNYPAGIPVARIVQLEKAMGTPYYRTQTEPLARLGKIDYVLIMPLNDKKLPESPPTSQKINSKHKKKKHEVKK